MTEIKDDMEISDKEIQIGIRCAKCGLTVLPNQPHQCKGEEDEKSE